MKSPFDRAPRPTLTPAVKVTKETTVEDAIKAWMAFYSAGRIPWSEGILKTNMRSFSDYFPGKPVGSFTRDDIASWVTWIRHERVWRGKVGNSGNTTRRKLVSIHGFFRWCWEDGLLDRNPVQWHRLPTIPKELPARVPFTYQEYETILNAAKSPKVHDFWPSAIIIAWNTGLRCKDVCNLRWEHDENGNGSKVDFEQEIIVARPSKRAAIRQRLEIPMSPELYEHLLELSLNRKIEASPYVLPMLHGRSLGRRDLHTEFRGICDSVGLTRLSFHSFRHGFVTRLLNAGSDPITISAMTGQTIEQVQEYSHVSNEAKRNALDRARAAMHAAKLRDLRAGMEPEATPSSQPVDIQL